MYRIDLLFKIDGEKSKPNGLLFFCWNYIVLSLDWFL